MKDYNYYVIQQRINGKWIEIDIRSNLIDKVSGYATYCQDSDITLRCLGVKKSGDRETKKQLWVTYSREDIEEEIENLKLELILPEDYDYYVIHQRIDGRWIEIDIRKNFLDKNTGYATYSKGSDMTLRCFGVSKLEERVIRKRLWITQKMEGFDHYVIQKRINGEWNEIDKRSDFLDKITGYATYSDGSDMTLRCLGMQKLRDKETEKELWVSYSLKDILE